MLFLLGKERKTEHNTHFCMPLKPVFTRCCGNGVHFTDEPTGALNRSAAEEVMTELTRLNREGTSILLVTHDSKVASVCNRILYLLDGQICGELHMEQPESGAEGNERHREERVNRWLREMEW